MRSQFTQEEYDQLAQTVEMFEVIARSQPHDCQALETLKDAYTRLGQTDEMLRVSKQLAEAFFVNGQFSQALIECEAILQIEPDSPDIVAILGELEARTERQVLPTETPAISAQFANSMNSIPFSGLPPSDNGSEAGHSAHSPESHGANLIRIPQGGFSQKTKSPGAIQINYDADVSQPQLIETTGTVGGGRKARIDLGDDGRNAFGAYLVNQGLAPANIVQGVLARLNDEAAENPDGPVPSLLANICRDGDLDIEEVLSRLVDLTKMPFIPLEQYDIDKNVVRRFPEDVTLGRLILPFDELGRTLLVAICNPFDTAGRQHAQQQVDSHIEWFFASPVALRARVASAYGIKNFR